MGEPVDASANVRRAGFERPTFASEYHDARPRPASSLVRTLRQYARVDRPRVLDLGCGTGLSTEMWLDHADVIIGLDASRSMLDVARKRVGDEKVQWVQRPAHDTGLTTGEIDIVVSAWSFHWMEPVTTLAEIARVLRPGGVFAAVDGDLPAIDAEVEQASMAFAARARAVRDERNIDAGADKAVIWPKDGHLEHIRRSGAFAYVREFVAEIVEPITVERFVNQTVNTVVTQTTGDSIRLAQATTGKGVTPLTT